MKRSIRAKNGGVPCTAMLANASTIGASSLLFLCKWVCISYVPVTSLGLRYHSSEMGSYHHSKSQQTETEEGGITYSWSLVVVSTTCPDSITGWSWGILLWLFLGNIRGTKWQSSKKAYQSFIFLWNITCELMWDPTDGSVFFPLETSSRTASIFSIILPPPKGNVWRTNEVMFWFQL